MLSRGTKSKNKKIRKLKIYPSVKLEQLSVIFILKYINNVIGHAKVYNFTSSSKMSRAIMSIIKYTG